MKTYSGPGTPAALSALPAAAPPWRARSSLRRRCPPPASTPCAVGMDGRDSPGRSPAVSGQQPGAVPPGRTLLTVLEEVCGVKIFHDTFEPTGTAACAISESFGGAILLNSGNPRWRRNHDLAHELFHLLTWSIFHIAPTSGVLQPSDQEESLATCFAANLLMPGDTFRSAIECRSDNGKIDYLKLYDVAREFDVSIESVIWRMHIVYNWGSEKSEETKTLIEIVKVYSSQYEDRKEESEPDKLPDRYRALAVKALRSGEISIGKFAEYLEVTRQRALMYLGEEGTDIEEIAYASS